MSDLGLVLVGPRANALDVTVDDDLPVLSVRAEAILPLEEDLESMVGYAASGTFHGPDSDRFELLDPDSVREETEMLWATAQVQSAGIAQTAAQWDRVLVVAWADEPALIPVVRALATLGRPTTVLVGGELAELPARALRRNHVVLADMIRHETLTAAIHNPDPAEVLDIALEAARHPPPRSTPRVKPVDVGPALDLAPTWCMPAMPASFHELVHVSMGHAAGLPQLTVDLAAWSAIRELVHGPPVDADMTEETGSRGRLPDGDVHAMVHQLLDEALGSIEFVGDQPLVEQISDALRPALRRVQELLEAVREVERGRLSAMRSFTAAGIHYTVQSLEAQLDSIRDNYPVEVSDELGTLLQGDRAVEGPVHITEWKRVFAGVPSCVVPNRQPGARTARRLVQDRFALFRAEFTAAVAERLDKLVKRARDPEAPPSTRELRMLRGRAERVSDALGDALQRLDERISLAADQCVRDDRFVRWACPDGDTLRRLLLNRIGSLPVGPALDKLATEALTRRRLGMSDDKDFEAYLRELARQVHGLADQARSDPGMVPTYEAVLLLLLQGRDPPVLRQAIARSASTEVELHLERPVEPALMNWLTATGMLVVVAPRLKTCAIYWQRHEHMSEPAADLERTICSEHRLGDLLLPPPDGDTVGSLVALIRSAVAVVAGITLGELSVDRREGVAVHEVRGRGLDLPPQTVLPHGALQVLARDEELLARLQRRIERRISLLALQPDARETVKKLVELASLGPSPTLAAQIGLMGARFEHLEQPIHALLQNHAEHAVAAMADCLDAMEIGRATLTPARRTLLDLQQLAPSGEAA